MMTASVHHDWLRAIATASGSTWLAVALAAAAGSITILVAWPLMACFRGRRWGKAIRPDGPSHGQKAGTPTMGGLAMIVALAVAVGLAGLAVPSLRQDRSLATLGLAVALFATLGLADDLQGLALRHSQREVGVGLTARWAFALQAIGAVAIAWSIGPSHVVLEPLRLADRLGLLPDDVWAGLQSGGSWTTGLGWAVAVIVILGAVNGVNLSDGLDGLASGLCAISLWALGMATSMLHSATRFDALGASTLRWPLPALVAAAAGGASAGFLFWNRYPARLFMGNVGSMTLGVILATVTLQAGTWWLLPIVGVVFVAEVLSDILQVAYFKATHGRRLFRMAPIHHHFELGGWPEQRVVRRFWLAGLVAAAVGLLAVAWLTGWASPSSSPT